jgi:hypothetical protein
MMNPVYLQAVDSLPSNATSSTASYALVASEGTVSQNFSVILRKAEAQKGTTFHQLQFFKTTVL